MSEGERVCERERVSGRASEIERERKREREREELDRALAAHISLRSKSLWPLGLAHGVLLATYVCVAKLALCVVKLARTRRRRAVAPRSVCSKVYTQLRGVSVDTPTPA